MYRGHLRTTLAEEAEDETVVAVIIDTAARNQHPRPSAVARPCRTESLAIEADGGGGSSTASATVFDRKPRLVSAATQVVIRRRSTNKDKRCLDSCLATAAPAVHELKHS